MKIRLKRISRCGLWLSVLSLTMGVGATRCFAQTCKAPTPQKQAELTTYVVKLNHFSPTGQLTLLESTQANDQCYWKLHYQESSPKTEVIVYLTPDGQYLLPKLYDLRVDPLAEERAETDAMMKTLEADDPPAQGMANAPVTIVEFLDFQCPYCKRMADVLEKDLTADERKSIRIVFRNFPLPMHPWAKDAAEIAGCAALQSNDAFWKVHDYLFQNQATITASNVRDNATAFALTNAGVDKEKFQTCLDRKMAVGGVTADTDLGSKIGVHATPTLFINGTKYEGMKDAASLRAIIADARKAQMSDAGAANPKVASTK